MCDYWETHIDELARKRQTNRRSRVATSASILSHVVCNPRSGPSVVHLEMFFKAYSDLIHLHFANEGEKLDCIALITSHKHLYNVVSSVVMAASIDCGIITGYVAERVSWRLMHKAKIIALLQREGLDKLSFRGVHSSCFCGCASSRSLMTIDIYMKRFLPELGSRLDAVVNGKSRPSELISTFIALLLFHFEEGVRLRGRLTVAFVRFNEQFFGGSSCDYSHKQQNMSPAGR